MTENSTETTQTHRAGLFDIRMIIAALVGLYGVILVITGIVSSDSSVKNSSSINVWCGIAMVVVGVAFAAWARLRPIVVPDHVETDGDERPAGH